MQTQIPERVEPVFKGMARAGVKEHGGPALSAIADDPHTLDQKIERVLAPGTLKFDFHRLLISLRLPKRKRATPAVITEAALSQEVRAEEPNPGSRHGADKKKLEPKSNFCPVRF